MGFIGVQPASVPLTASDITNDIINADKIADNSISEEHLDPTVITGLSALGAEPADTDELLISDAGTLKRMDYSYIKGGGAYNLISATAVTDGVSAFNIASVFSSSYQMYLMIVQNIRITADANVRLRFGASGTYNSTSQYRYVGTMTDRSGTDRTYHDGSDGLSHAFGFYYIANPYISATNSNRKRVTGHYNVANESGNSVLTTCNFAGELEVSTTAFDGIRLLVDSGNFRGGTANDGDGMIKIYGIADS